MDFCIRCFCMTGNNKHYTELDTFKCKDQSQGYCRVPIQVQPISAHKVPLCERIDYWRERERGQHQKMWLWFVDVWLHLDSHNLDHYRFGTALLWVQTLFTSMPQKEDKYLLVGFFFPRWLRWFVQSKFSCELLTALSAFSHLLSYDDEWVKGKMR